ncbi:MAG TPA: tetratricopeptide repeat protein [Candidatus Sulfotelmatobacter sp.]|jgi:tetratricopeptide (TPR) repeat protein
MPRRRSILPRYFERLLRALFLLASVLAANAQRGGLNDPRPLQEVYTTYQTAPGTGVLIFTVYAERTSRHLDRQALLKLVNISNPQSATWQTTEDNSQGVFTNIPYGSYDVEVSAVGFLSTHQQLQVMSSLRPSQIDVVLHPDPEAIKLDVAGAALSPQTRKQIRRAVSALKSENLKSAEKELDQAYKSSPSNPDLNFLLGYLYFQKKDFARAETFLVAAVNLNPRNVQALTLLGRAGLERQDYPAARSALEQAITADAENWLPHDLLADAYLHQQNYDKARDEAKIAISKGQSAASPAQLILGQALVSLGRDQEAIQALHTFLEQSPATPIGFHVRSLIAEIEQHHSGLLGVDPMAALSDPGPSVNWKPPSIDEIKPAVAAGVACPYDQVIEESGKRVQELVADVARFAAVEDLFHQSLDPFGIPIRTETRKYNYVAAITEPQPGSLSVDEFRADKLALAGYPDQISSTGFATFALVFHPYMRGDFEMSCEGLGDWHGQASWLVHFRQRADRPNHMHSYNVGSVTHPVALKGRAWITADKFQIVRMEADLVNPMPEIELLTEHQVVEYGPVPFPKKNTSLWLPKSAEIYFDFRKHRYYRRHSFDHYMLYSVDTEEKRKEPVARPAPEAKPS